GFDPVNGDRIVEIGCVELVNHIPSGRFWHCYLNPERPMPDAAFKVHGLSDDFLKDKPLFSAVAGDFLAFIEGASLVIHNAGFDIGFLNAELGRLGLEPLTMARVVDTLALARRKHPGAQNSLDALCKRYRVDASARQKHGALLDSELLAEVYIELIGGHQARLELAAQDMAAAVQAAATAPAQQRPRPLLPRCSTEEAAAHRAFVAALGAEAIWLRYGEAQAVVTSAD
ncbi:MAG: DNA polymerase III subunit epsilon, partial [Pseudomonadota bacterium]|nr:DNA polymerase III subunit epsilon [Pseudomonadota bacterium]